MDAASDIAVSGEVRNVKALVVAHDTPLLRELAVLLKPYCRRVISADSAADALAILADQRPELVVVDLSEPGREPLRLLRVTGEVVPAAKVIAIVGGQDMGRAITAIRRGAYDCIGKPFDNERFLTSARRAIEEIIEWTRRESNEGGLAYWANGKVLIGQSRCMKEVWQRIEMVKDVLSNVLIRGETGSGKELVAYAIHDSSPRADGPFVKLNCGAIPKDLLESELFGHEKGSFTGALQRRIGRFEMADGGTILLDEIGDMPLDLQVKLLGVLQDRVVQRVGGHEKVPVDVRIIAATHQDLRAAIEEKRFREDLYYRLNVITFEVPPLRERREDIPLLADHFVKLYSRQTGRRVTGVDPEAMEVLVAYDYRGNVRELENIIESCVVLCGGDRITVKDLPAHLTEERTRGHEIDFKPGMSLDEVERLWIIGALHHTGGNKTRAAELLGVPVRSLYHKIRRYKISADRLGKGA